ncbi:MAG: argininosuccinate lyase, partial [Vicinamibacteria bacterium]
ATELADYLVDRGVDFRRAHGIVGEILATAADKGVDPATLDLKTLRGFSDVFDEDVARVWDFRAAVERKSSRGGVASKAISEQIDLARKALSRD